MSNQENQKKEDLKEKAKAYVTQTETETESEVQSDAFESTVISSCNYLETIKLKNGRNQYSSSRVKTKKCLIQNQNYHDSDDDIWILLHYCPRTLLLCTSCHEYRINNVL